MVIIYFYIVQLVGDHKPTTLVVDMEQAAVQGFLQVFGATEIVFCYFHWHKVTDKVKIYFQNGIIFTILEMINQFIKII